MRRWWCTGEGDAREHLGLAVLLHQGMRVWMRVAAPAESPKTVGDDLAAPPRTSREASDGVLSHPLHSEVARLLASMAIGTINAKEQTA